VKPQLTEARRESRRAQDAHRVFDEGGRDVAQHARLEIAQSAAGIDEPAVGRARHRVDGQIAALQVLLERHLGRGVHDEAAVARRRLALGARERVLLVALWMQEHREVAPHGAIAGALHLRLGGADHDPVALPDRQAEQLVANGAADQVAFHGGIVPSVPPCAAGCYRCARVPKPAAIAADRRPAARRLRHHWLLRPGDLRPPQPDVRAHADR
jgi:hypothetical protein